jgi:hypothetical protein
MHQSRRISVQDVSSQCPLLYTVAESFSSIMKQEELSLNWYETPEELEKTVADYISNFNSYRPLQKHGNLNPDQHESDTPKRT